MKLTKAPRETSAIDTLRREMDQIFDDLIPISWQTLDGRRVADTWSPSADISEDENEYMIRVDLPGFGKNDIKVNYQEGRISISGERHREEKEEKKDFIRRERYEGSFYRTFLLPDAVREDEIEATFKDGVLKVNIPKAETVKPKSIKVS